MSKQTRTIALGLLAALGVVHVASAQDAAIKTLVEQGQYWQQRGDNGRAAEAWRKLLLISPNHPEALFGAGMAEMDAGKPEAARTYLDRLKRAGGAASQVSRLEQAINQGRAPQQIELARQQAKSGQNDQAVETYRKFLNGTEPQGQLALEYYQTMGGSKTSWDEGRRGLEKLVKDNPKDLRAQLALAQHLTYRDATRKEGIDRLSKLTANAEIERASADAWQKALTWSGTRPSDAPLYQAYLKVYPKDEVIQQRLELTKKTKQEVSKPVVVKIDPAIIHSNDGFKALQAGDLAAAEADFQASLRKRPGNRDALGGLGVVNLRQDRFEPAVKYLHAAAQGKGGARWKSAYDSARYWLWVRQADAERNSGNADRAMRLLADAMRLETGDPVATVMLSDLLATQGHLPEAENGYRKVLAQDVNNMDAWSGLVTLLTRTGRADQAQQTLDALSAEQKAQITDMGKLQAAISASQGKAALAAGDFVTARVALERSLVQEPSNPWVRLELARVYLKVGARNEARGLVDGLVISHPNMPDALYASAMLAAESREWAKALGALEQIPPDARTRDMANLYRRAYIQTQVANANLLASQGRKQEAWITLSQMEMIAGQDPELLGALASGYVDIGDSTRALSNFRQLMARSQKIDPALLLQYANLLSKTRQDVELVGILRTVNPAALSPQQRQSFEDLRVGYVVRQADGLREAGDVAAAYDALAPTLATRPRDPSLLGALARMYASANDPAQAAAIYSQLIAVEPGNPDHYIAQAGLAMQAQDYAMAASALETAQRLSPQNPEVLASIGRMYRAQGDNTRAEEYFAAALTVQARGASIGTAQVMGGSTNPFRNVQTQAARSPNPFAALSAPRGVTAPALPVLTPMPLVYPAPAPAAGVLAPVYSPVPNLPAAFTAPAATTLPPLKTQFLPDPVGATRFQTLNAPPVLAQAPAHVPTSPLNYLPADMLGAEKKLEKSPERKASPTVATRKKSRTSTSYASMGCDELRAIDSDSLSHKKLHALTRELQRCGDDSGKLAKNQPAAVAPVPVAAAAQPLFLPQNMMLAERLQMAQPVLPVQPYATSPLFAAQGPVYMPQPVQAAQPVYAPQPVQAGSTLAQVNAPKTVADELRELRQEKATVVSAGALSSFRQGEAGMSQLTQVEAPLELKMAMGDGKLLFRATPVFLSAGSVSGGYSTSSRFGGGPAASVASPGVSPGSQNRSGVGFSVAYETDNLQADVGVTPLGFLYENLVGGVKYKFPLSKEFTLSGEFSRRAVTDSLLSYSGAQDRRTGMKWGGVTATGGRLDLIYDQVDYGIYGYGAAHAIDGTNVVSNTRLEFGGGLYWHATRTQFNKFTVGVNLTGISFDKNLRYFTYGHGGYFSPQGYGSISIPVEWSQKQSRLNYTVKGSVGYQFFREDSANYFPGSSALQTAAGTAAANAVTATYTNVARSVYPGQSKAGLGFSFDAAMEYQLAPQAYMGGRIGASNASDYRVFNAGVYFRYALDRIGVASSFPLVPYRATYGSQFN